MGISRTFDFTFVVVIIAGVWLRLLGVVVVVVVGACVMEVAGGGDRGQLAATGCKGGLELLRTLVCELELELEEEDDEEEAEAEAEEEPEDDDEELQPDILAADAVDKLAVDVRGNT